MNAFLSENNVVRQIIFINSICVIHILVCEKRQVATSSREGIFAIL